MNRTLLKNQAGIGLIEVLVALVVVSLGVLALTSLQGAFLSSSGQSKARAEARVIAEQQLENYRNNVLLDDGSGGGYTNLSSTTMTVTGKNAIFNVESGVNDGTETNQKLITIMVSWVNNDNQTESVTVSSELVWADPSMTILASDANANAGTGALAPSPNSNSSELGGETGLSGGSLAIPESDSSNANYDSSLASFNNLSYVFDSQGNRVLYNNNTGDALLTCFGHKIHSIRGVVYTVNNLNAIGVNVSQYGYCQFDGGSNQDTAPYACFVCGNCSESWGSLDCQLASGATPATSPTEWAAYSDNGIGPGGWRGKIGLDGVDDDGGGQEQVCFNEQILDANAGAATGREYTTHRIDSGVTTSEGINTSYACHDFLVVNSSGPNSSCASAASSLSSVTNIAPKKFTRVLNGNSATAPNTVQGLDSAFCNLAPSSVTLTGEITLGGTKNVNLNKLTLSTDASGTCDTLATNTPGTYTLSCTATTAASTVTITLVTTQNNTTITPQTSYTVSNSDNATAFDFTVTSN